MGASSAREDARGYSPPQHASGRAPDPNGRFYTPEYEALPTGRIRIVPIVLNSKNRSRSSCQGRMSTVGARTRERQRPPRVLLVSCVPHPEGTTKKRDPQAHFH